VSKCNTQFVLPPHERPPGLAPAEEAQLPLGGNRPASAAAEETLPGTALPIDVMGRVLNTASDALSDLRFARAQNDWAALEDAAKRLAAALRPDPLALARNLARTIAAERPREKSHQAKE